jgi:hypothetical protein
MLEDDYLVSKRYRLKLFITKPLDILKAMLSSSYVLINISPIDIVNPNISINHEKGCNNSICNSCLQDDDYSECFNCNTYQCCNIKCYECDKVLCNDRIEDHIHY